MASMPSRLCLNAVIYTLENFKDKLCSVFKKADACYLRISVTKLHFGDI